LRLVYYVVNISSAASLAFKKNVLHDVIVTFLSSLDHC